LRRRPWGIRLRLSAIAPSFACGNRLCRSSEDLMTAPSPGLRTVSLDA
jgi:hypothetical protein